MKDIEYWRDSAQPVEGNVVGHTTVDMGAARGMTVGPDEILVVVFPTYAREVVAQHRALLHETLDDRFILIVGDDVRLAKVKTEDWGRNALEG